MNTLPKVTIQAPLYVQLAKSEKAKKYHINLNGYRNWHYIVSNNIKKKYKSILETQLLGLNFEGRLKLTFTLWKKDRRKIDRANPLCIHEKFFCDALVEYGCIPDDNDNYIESTHYYTGGIDKDNPRVEIIIEEILDKS